MLFEYVIYKLKFIDFKRTIKIFLKIVFDYTFSSLGIFIFCRSGKL